MQKLRDRFFSKIRRDGECAVWTGARNAGGYGDMGRVEGQRALAHRVSWYLKYGVWPASLMHTCDNPACVRPTHLKEGTQAENMADKVAKNRQLKSTQVHSAKLTDADVAQIRHLAATTNRSYQDIADQYGVWLSTVAQICYGNQRKHTLAAPPQGRKRKRYLVYGEMLSVPEIATKYDLTEHQVYARIRQGATDAQIVRARYTHT